jgi:hypothetical protein
MHGENSKHVTRDREGKKKIVTAIRGNIFYTEVTETGSSAEGSSRELSLHFIAVHTISMIV